MKASLLSYLKKIAIQASTAGLPRSLHAQKVVSDRTAKQFVSEYAKRYLIKTVYDIGANQGAWSKEWVKILPGAEFMLFEASSFHQKALSGSGFQYHLGLLGAKDGVEVAFYESIDGSRHTGSSMYLEAFAPEGAFRPTRAVSRTLDSVVAEKHISHPDFMKLDVQGAELDILSGAVGLTNQCRLFLLEVPIAEYNHGAPVLGQYVDFMHGLGLTCVCVSDVHYSVGTSDANKSEFPFLLQLDLLFARLVE